MALTVSRSQSPLGGLGTLLGIGGALTGNPWLTAAGMGAKAIGGGGAGAVTQGGLDALTQIAQNMGWINPATGNVASSNPMEDQLQSQVTERDLEKWLRPYANSYYSY